MFIRLFMKGSYTVTINWNWQRLIIGIVSAILGWLSSIVLPPPGNNPPAPSPQVERLK